MPEIDNWIKEQLKKGFKKEQIKEGLRKAGYQQNTIDSVDSFANITKKKRNFNIALIFFIVVIAGIAFYLIYQSTFSNNEEVNKNKEVELSPLLSSVSEVLGDKEETLRLLEDRGKIVNITSDGFEPKEMTIEVDQSVSFVNQDTKEHKLFSNANIPTRLIKAGDIYTFIPREEGIFIFHFEDWPETKGQAIITERTK